MAVQFRDYYEALGFVFDDKSFAETCHRFVERFMAGIANLNLVPGMRDVLDSLKLGGLDQSILSASRRVVKSVRPIPDMLP